MGRAGGADDGAEVVGYDLGSDTARLELVLGDDADRGDARPGRHHRPRRARAGARRARDHARRAPRRAPGAVRPREPSARDAGQRRGHGQRLRRGRPPARPHPRRRLRELGRGLRAVRPLPRAGVAAGRAPATLYGVSKLADEGIARVYAADAGSPSIGLRPYVVYGPGRDQGMTSGPTAAMAAAARGEPYEIGFSGRAQYDYAPDVGARPSSIAASIRHDGAAVYNFPGVPAAVDEVVAAIHAVVPDAAITWSGDAAAVPRRARGRSASTATSARSRARRSTTVSRATIAPSGPLDVARRVDHPVERRSPAAGVGAAASVRSSADRGPDIVDVARSPARARRTSAQRGSPGGSRRSSRRSRGSLQLPLVLGPGRAGALPLPRPACLGAQRPQPRAAARRPHPRGAPRPRQATRRSASASTRLTRGARGRTSRGPRRPIAGLDGPVAFFCAEFGIHSSLPIYSGGLGVLAGDILKEASDLASRWSASGSSTGAATSSSGSTARGLQHEYWVQIVPEHLPTVHVDARRRRAARG